jgi:hypothetical protein
MDVEVLFGEFLERKGKRLRKRFPFDYVAQTRTPMGGFNCLSNR